jgi:putative ABC transport system permease protein
MEWMRILLSRFATSVHRQQLDADLEEELETHIELATEENRMRGMPEEEARKVALRSFGGLTQTREQYRVEQGLPILESLVSDVHFAARQLLKSPGFAGTAVLMLAVGIGATTAIFSIVEGVLLRPLPFPHSDRLMVLSDFIKDAGEAGVTVPDIKNYTRDTHSFTSLGGYQTTGFELSGAGDPASVNATRMTAGVFQTLGVSPLMGRLFTQQEDDQHHPVVVLSYGMWQSRFHGDRNVVGTKIFLARKPYVVIGVMPRNFEFPLVPGHVNQSELWVPVSFNEQELSPDAAGGWNFAMVGRLKPNISAQQAIRDAENVARETMRSYPPFMAGLRIRPIVRPLREETVEQARPLIRTLFLAVVVVLLMVCANLAGLLLVRAIRRRREIAVRLALGASSATLLWQALLQSSVLSMAGGTLGLILAAAALRSGISLLPETLPRVREIGLDWQVASFALGLALVTGVICGLVPAFAAVRTNVNSALKGGVRTGTAGGEHARLRSALVIVETAVALVLLAASGLLLRSFEKMRQVNLGFQPDHTLTASYGLPRKQYSTQASVDEFNHEVVRRLQQLPGVKSVGLSSFLPASGANNNTVIVAEGSVAPECAGMNLSTTIEVDGDYFRAMGIPLLRGRLFTAEDKAGAQLAVIVNRKLAEQSWPGQDPIGKRLRLGTDSTKTPWATVVGEVADVKDSSPDLPINQQYYTVIDQTQMLAGSQGTPGDLHGNGGFIVLRTSLPPEQMENALRTTVRSLDPQLPLSQMQTMEQAIADSEAPRRFNTILIASFASIAVLLAVLGIYSVIAFSVAQRAHEMAIRMALGSERWGVVRIILASGAKLAAAGCAIGLAGAFAASHLLRSFLFGVSEVDPLVLTLAAVVLMLLSLAASLVPARRAATVNLTELRTE